MPCAFDGEEEKWSQIKSSPSASASSLDTTTGTNNKSRSAPLASTTSTAKVYSVLGHQLAEVLDDTQLSGMLGAEVVDMSRRASGG